MQEQLAFLFDESLGHWLQLNEDWMHRYTGAAFTDIAGLAVRRTGAVSTYRGARLPRAALAPKGGTRSNGAAVSVRG